MKPLPTILIAAALFCGCGKGELDPDTLTNNPFDPSYTGPGVYEFDTTYLDVVVIPGGVITYQVIAFRVKEELFLSDAAYSVQVHDRESGITSVIEPDPSGSDHFRYLKPDAVIGSPVCLDLRLYNNQSAARAEEICATLQ